MSQPNASGLRRSRRSFCGRLSRYSSKTYTSASALTTDNTTHSRCMSLSLSHKGWVDLRPPTSPVATVCRCARPARDAASITGIALCTSMMQSYSGRIMGRCCPIYHGSNKDTNKHALRWAHNLHRSLQQRAGWLINEPAHKRTELNAITFYGSSHHVDLGLED